MLKRRVLILSHRVRNSKIQLTVQFGNPFERLPAQIVRQVQEAIDAGHIAEGTRLPSSRSLARALGVSRNTVIAAYEELAARGFVRSRRGAAIYACVPPATHGFDLRRVTREAQYPSRWLVLRDEDGNSIYIT